MRRYGSRVLVELADCWGVKEGLRIRFPVLELGREVSVEDMTCHRCDLECGLVSLEKARKNIDWATLCRSRSFIVFAVGERFSY